MTLPLFRGVAFDHVQGVAVAREGNFALLVVGICLERRERVFDVEYYGLTLKFTLNDVLEIGPRCMPGRRYLG